MVSRAKWAGFSGSARGIQDRAFFRDGVVCLFRAMVEEAVDGVWDGEIAWRG